MGWKALLALKETIKEIMIYEGNLLVKAYAMPSMFKNF